MMRKYQSKNKNIDYLYYLTIGSIYNNWKNKLVQVNKLKSRMSHTLFH